MKIKYQKSLNLQLEKFKGEKSMKHSSIRHQAEHDVIPNNIEDFKIVQEKSDSQVSIIKL